MAQKGRAMTGDPLTIYLYIFVGGFAATYVWRYLGFVFAERLDPDSEALVWVRLVATALMAALVARLIFLPPGALAETALISRLAGMAAGLAAFFIAGRYLSHAVLAAAAVFVVLEVIRRGGFG
jgi:branched-subunit amino acid transport protein